MPCDPDSGSTLQSLSMAIDYTAHEDPTPTDNGLDIAASGSVTYTRINPTDLQRACYLLSGDTVDAEAYYQSLLTQGQFLINGPGGKQTKCCPCRGDLYFAIADSVKIGTLTFIQATGIGAPPAPPPQDVWFSATPTIQFAQCRANYLDNLMDDPDGAFATVGVSVDTVVPGTVTPPVNAEITITVTAPLNQRFTGSADISGTLPDGTPYAFALGPVMDLSALTLPSGILATIETGGIRLGFVGAYGAQPITPPTVTANTLQSIAQVPNKESYSVGYFIGFLDVGGDPADLVMSLIDTIDGTNDTPCGGFNDSKDGSFTNPDTTYSLDLSSG